MRLLFSKIEISTDNENIAFFIGGVPRSEGDLIGWPIFDQFISRVDAPTEISVCAESFIIEGGEIKAATQEELKDIERRISADAGFLQEHADYTGNSEFSFIFAPEERQEEIGGLELQ